MLAQLFVILPFELTIPEGENYTIYAYEDSGFLISIHMPAKSDRPLPADDADEIKIDGKKSFRGNCLRIDFKKDSFDRSPGSQSNLTLCDPPYEFIAKTINSFLIKLRFFTRGSRIHPIDFPCPYWRLTYLNDDESELEKSKGLVRARGAFGLTVSWTALDSKMWDAIHKLPPSFVPPEWDSLLLDADQAWPHIGQVVVLVATSLEVFISYVLNQMSDRGAIQKNIWEWMNNRKYNWLEPAVEEQYGELLKIAIGYSLKEDKDLWEVFMNIKTARNKFVHEGKAKLGGKSVSAIQAREFIIKAEEITKLIGSKLPKELQLPEYINTMKVEAYAKPFPIQNQGII